MAATAPLPEPAGLRDHLLELVLEDRAPTAELAAVAGYALTAAWGEELRSRGVEAGVLRATIHGYQRELRLWVVGERRWQPTAEALLERAARRVPARRPTTAPAAATAAPPPAVAARASQAQPRAARRPAA